MPDKEWLYPNLRENGYTYSVLENLHYIPHVHGGLECVYVLDGELCATIDEKNYTLKKGDVCLIFPQVRHSYRTPKHSNSFCFALLHDTMPDDLRSLFVDGYALPNPIYRAGSYSPLIPEMIDHLHNGYVARYKSSEDFANGIHWILTDPEYDELSAQACRKVLGNYSESIIAKKYTDLYNKVTGKYA